jgi:hypothetical protein
MHRTTILLSHDLRREAELVAKGRGISLSELIRRQLAALVRGSKSAPRARDPIFRPRNLMRHANPRDIAANHDEYLYGAPSKSRRK